MVSEVSALLDRHLREHYAFYGEFMGVRTARKHIGWYVEDLVDGEAFRQQMNKLETCEEQLAAVNMFFDSRPTERLQYRPSENISKVELDQGSSQALAAWVISLIAFDLCNVQYFGGSLNQFYLSLTLGICWLYTSDRSH